MFPSALEYRAAGDLDEAVSLLHEHGDDAKVLAGGQSLVPLLKLRFATPSIVVDIGRVDGMSGISQRDGTLRIGALTRHADVETSPGLRDLCRILTDTAPLVSDPLVRNMGTVGGSVCHADPQGDWASVMLALNASVVARSWAGERSIPMTEFLEGPFTTALRPDEVVTEIRVRLPRGPASGTYLKLERKVGDFATVGVAVQVELADGHVGTAGIGLTAVGGTNIKATAAEAALAGQTPTDDVIAEAARLAADAAEPKDDIRGSADYKRDVVRVFVQRGLRTALGRALEATA